MAKRGGHTKCFRHNPNPPCLHCTHSHTDAHTHTHTHTHTQAHTHAHTQAHTQAHTHLPLTTLIHLSQNSARATSLRDYSDGCNLLPGDFIMACWPAHTHTFIHTHTLTHS